MGAWLCPSRAQTPVKREATTPLYGLSWNLVVITKLFSRLLLLQSRGVRIQNSESRRKTNKFSHSGSRLLIPGSDYTKDSLDNNNGISTKNVNPESRVSDYHWNSSCSPNDWWYTTQLSRIRTFRQSASWKKQTARHRRAGKEAVERTGDIPPSAANKPVNDFLTKSPFLSIAWQYIHFLLFF